MEKKLQANEKPRYRIALKRGYAVLYISIAGFFFACALLTGIAATQTNPMLLSLLMSGGFLFWGGCILVELSIRCEAYKGRIVYSSLVKKKEYRLSDIAFSKEKLEEIHVDHGDGNATDSWDLVTTFYDRQGKKLFKFGMAYSNVDLLVKDVANTQKSIRNQKQKR